MAGFGKYLRFIVRRERVMSSVWAVTLILFTWAIAAYYPTLFPDSASIASMAEMLKSPAMVGMMGPVFGGASPTVAMMFTQEMSVWIFIAVAVMNVFFVNRHTRADEELGRLEMFRALPVGRHAGAASVICGAFVLNTIIAALTTLLVMSAGMNDANFVGSLAYSAAVFGVGLFFAAITLFFAQLFSTARGLTGAAFAILGAAYMLRAVGDVADNALSYISPLGLGLRVFAFYENNFQYVSILLIESVALTAAAFAVLSIRDHGQGVIPAQKGQGEASRFLRSPFGLAWRLTRNGVFVWCAAVFIIGAMYGALFGDIEDFANQNDYYKQIIAGGTDIAGSMIDNFAAFLFVIMTLISVIPVITIAGKIHAEERRGRLEHVFARGVSRTKMYGAYILIGAVASVALQFCAALGVYAASSGLVKFGDMLTASLAYLPAMWLILGLVVFLVGATPKLTALVWVVYGYAAFAAIFLRVFDLPDWLPKLSPFGNVPMLPVAQFEVLPLVVLSAVAIALTGFGIFRYTRRDLLS